MKLPFTIEDHYGTEITVEPVMSSIGPVVDLTRNWSERDDSPGEAYVDRSSFDRLPPEDALNLAEAIKAAVEARF